MTIITVNFNRPNFLEVQLPLIVKNLQPSGIHVVNTGHRNNGTKEISKRFDARYTFLDTGTNDYSRSHAMALNVAYSFNRQDTDIIGILDHDCFPIRPVNIAEKISGHDFYASNQIREGRLYPNPCCMFMRSRIVADFMPCAGMDTGGQLHSVYNNVKQMAVTYPDYYELYDGAFLHIIKGSNWIGGDANFNRVEKVFEIVKSYL